MIAILTDPGVGGTFLNWSIYYLAGHSHYYSAAKQKLIPIIDNPLTDKNAHHFLPNQISNSEHFDKILKILIDNKSLYLNTIYFHHFRGAIKSYHQETADTIKKLLPHVSKTILLTASQDQVLYRCKFESRIHETKSYHNPEIVLTNDQERFNDFVSYFFVTSKEVWENQNLKDVWDQREFLALNCRPFNSSVSMKENLDLSRDHYHINTIELWDRFDESVGDLFRYLEIDIDNKNFKKWIDVYQQWKKLHKDRLFFTWYFDIIIDYVINGYNLDLVRFNLDLYQEAAIQHALIYRHNLNLKTWQLEKFTNTQQLHKLLEPNSHLLTKY
jgi:hypothetical protein